MAGQTRPVWDFEDIGDWWTRADAGRIAPIVAVPTTAGTGSEVGRAGVITDEKTHTKKIIFHPKMMPKVVIADPELTVGMPPFITAGTGMDALAHCLEAYCAEFYHPIATGMAVEGMRLVFENLPKAVKDGNDIEARAHMMSAAAMGATAFQKGLGAIHSLSHPVGALYDTHHGMTNGVFMPYVLVFNRSAIEEKIARLAAYLGIRGGFDGFLKAVARAAERDRRAAHAGRAEGRRRAGATRSPRWRSSIRRPAAIPVKLTKEGALQIFDMAMAGKLRPASEGQLFPSRRTARCRFFCAAPRSPDRRLELYAGQTPLLPDRRSPADRRSSNRSWNCLGRMVGFTKAQPRAVSSSGRGSCNRSRSAR